MTIDGATYTVDNAGLRTAKTDQRTAVTTSYAYDSIYQLLSATPSSGAPESYTYDPVGNRLNSAGVPSYSYNSSNELTSNSSASYGYDLNGNAITKNDSTGITTYAWDFENRLTSVTLPGSGGTVTFAYESTVATRLAETEIRDQDLGCDSGPRHHPNVLPINPNHP